jgi:magnesium chelatase family protein
MALEVKRVVRAHGAALFGIEAVAVEVEVSRASGVARGVILGQAEVEVREARDRLRIALETSRLWRGDGEQSLIVNLAPAGLRKNGTGLDLPIALAICGLFEHVPAAAIENLLSYAEVGLDGMLRPARGTLGVAMLARALGVQRLLVPPEVAREANEVGGLEVIAVRTLTDAVRAATGKLDPPLTWPPAPPPRPLENCDLSDVRGQRVARRALEVAAAGGHNILLIGPPGSGKTLLARRLPTILPPLTRDEALEVTRVHSVAGLGDGAGLLRERPFRAPHHTISAAGLIGGGSNLPRPGELTLALHGVLFLDELPEFSRGVLETLRQPLEDGAVHVARKGGSARFPTTLSLVAAMNPCPCGWRGSGMRSCACSPGMVHRYLSRVSGPVLDRIDIQVDVPAISAADLAHTDRGESSAIVRERVLAARARQLERNPRCGVLWNAWLRPRDLDALCRVSEAARRALDTAMTRLKFSARAHDRILRVARTLADLAGRDDIDVPQIAEAISYRSLDRADVAGV